MKFFTLILITISAFVFLNPAYSGDGGRTPVETSVLDAMNSRHPAESDYRKPEEAQVHTLIQLQPTDWPGLRYVQNSTGKHSLNSNAVLWDQVSFPDAKQVVEKVLSHSPKKEYLVQAINAMAEGKLDVQVIYGLQLWPHFSGIGYAAKEDSGLRPREELKLILGALQRIQSQLPRPLFLWVMDPIDPEILSELHAPHQRVEVVTGDFPSQAKTSQLKPGDIRILNIGPLPQPVFDAFLENTSFPPIIE
jgi:hypothetical protein